MRATRPVLALLAVLALAACQGSTYPTPVVVYRLGPGANQLTVTVPTDEPDQVAHVTVTQETSEAVQLRAELDSLDPPPDPHEPPIGVGYEVQVIVTLAEPLGARTVLAEDGGPVLPQPSFTP